VVLSAVRGALGFCSRLPLRHDDPDWDAFRRAPVAFPLAGYVVGLLLALPVGLALLAGLPAPVAAAAYLLVAYLVTGVNHADGVADLGDAAAVHGSPRERREVMKDTTVGVGAVLALALVGGVLTALALTRWASRTLGGVGGDVFGATNDLGRVVALHLGVVVWVL